MKLLKRLSLVVVMLASAITSWAQVSFKVDAPALTAAGQPFRVEFTVDQEPERNSMEAPSFEGFDILAGPSVSTGHSIQFINGKQSASYSCTYTYVLMPTSAGKYTIGSASIKVDGKRYSTEPQPIEVIAEKSNTSNSSANANNNPESHIGKDDILIRMKVSDTEVYKGESVRASLVLYTRANIDDIENFSLPAFDGFWSQELSFDNTPSREEYNGRIYETYKLTEVLLSPQQTGNITIPAASLTARAQVIMQDNRGANPFFGGRQIYHVSRDIKSSPVTIHVKDFPAGAPASFNGAIGEFRLSSKMPSKDIDSNSADQIEITISGIGNLKFLNTPKITLPESFEQYDTKVVDNITVTPTNTSGSITYTYPFVARSAGEFTIESLQFTYFDPSVGEYKTLSTEPFTITVHDDGSSVASPVHVERYSGYGGAMRQLDRDIRYIHLGKLPKREASIMVLTPVYWLIVVALLSMFVVAYVLLSKRIRDNRNIVARRMKRADKVAIQRLRSAERYMNEGSRHAFYEELLRALWGYISDKFNIPVSTLTKERIREELYRRNVTSSTTEEFCEIISRAEEAQYSPSTDGDMNDAYAMAVDIMSKIEDAIKR